MRPSFDFCRKIQSPEVKGLQYKACETPDMVKRRGRSVKNGNRYAQFTRETQGKYSLAE